MRYNFISEKILKRLEKKTNLKAFTITELLVVIVLIGLLIIFSLLFGPPQIAKARDVVRKSQVDGVKKAIEEYFQDSDCYPIAIPVCGEQIKLGDSVIMDKIPCDPQTKNSYIYVSENSSCPKLFQLYGNLENEKDAIIGKLGCTNGCGPDCQFNYGASSTNQKLNPNCVELTTPTPSISLNPSLTPTITETPTPTPSEITEPTPIVLINQYVCAPGGECEVFADPVSSGCPDIYPDDNTCQDQCLSKTMRCHDSRGKNE